MLHVCAHNLTEADPLPQRCVFFLGSLDLDMENACDMEIEFSVIYSLQTYSTVHAIQGTNQK